MEEVLVKKSDYRLWAVLRDVLEQRDGTLACRALDKTSSGEGMKVKNASDAAVQANALLKNTVGEVRHSMLRTFRALADNAGLSLKKFIALVGAKTMKMDQSSLNKVLSGLRKSGVSLLLAVWVLGVPTTGQPTLSHFMNKAMFAMDSCAAEASERTPVRGNVPADRTFEKTPSLEQIFSGTERRQGFRDNCTIYSAIAGIEAQHGVSLPPDIAEDMWSMWKNRHNPDFYGGVDMFSALSYVYRSLGLKAPTLVINNEKETFIEHLKKGSIIFVGVRDATRKVFYGNPSKTLADTMIHGKEGDRQYDDSVASSQTSGSHAITVVGYVKDTGRVGEDGKPIDGFIIRQSWPKAGENTKGLILVEADKLMKSVTELSTVMSAPSAEETLAFEKAPKSNYDPFGKDIEYHRSAADEALTSLRFYGKDLVDGIEKLKNPEIGVNERQMALEDIDKIIFLVDSDMPVMENYFKKHSGIDMRLPRFDIMSVRNAVNAGNISEASKIASRFDSWCVEKVGPILSAAGNVMELKYLDSKAPFELSGEIASLMSAMQLHKATSTEECREVYNRLEALERVAKGKNEKGRELREILGDDGMKNIASVKKYVKQAYEEMQSTGKSHAIEHAAGLFAFIQSPIASRISDALLEVTDMELNARIEPGCNEIAR